MTTAMLEEAVQTLNIKRDVLIAAPIDITFEAIIEELGPGSEMPDGSPFPMRLERWPGGRWFRDLGGDSGHLWGHVQVIKPPSLLELCGPMFMSYPAVSHVQYRLKAEGAGTRLTLTHRAMGLILPEHLEGVGQGWEHGLNRIRQLAQRRVEAGRGTRYRL